MKTKALKFDYIGEKLGYGKRADLDKQIKAAYAALSPTTKPTRFRLNRADWMKTFTAKVPTSKKTTS